MNTMVLTRLAGRHGCPLRLPATPADWGQYRTPEGEAAYFALASGGERP